MFEIARIKATAFRILNIRHTESFMVSRLLGIQFMLGLATSFLVTASYSLFLYNYPVTEAPKVYLLAAFLLFPINAIYARLDLKFNSKKLLEFIILFAAISMALLLIWWKLGPVSWLPLLLVAWNLMLYMVVGYGYWGLASLLFNVRESRRIFSLIGSGDLPAKIIGYLSVSVLAPKLGIEPIMAFAVALFLGAYFLSRKLFSSSRFDWDQFESQQQHTPHGHTKHGSSQNWWERIFENKLILWIAAMSLLAYIVVLLVDFTFLSEIKARYTSMEELAKFFGLFFAAGRMVAILIKVLFTSRLIARLGLSSNLFITPAFIFIIAATALILPLSNPDAKTYLYAFGIMTLFCEILRSVIQEPVFFILFQPLNIHLRLKGHLVAKGYVYPPALLITGLSLGFWLYFHSSIPIPATLAIILALALLWMLTILPLKKQYYQVVQQSIQHGFFKGNSMFLTDQHVTNMLVQKTKTGNTRQRIHALQLLIQSKYPKIETLLIEQLQEIDLAMIRYVLEQLAKMESTQALPEIMRLEANPAFSSIQTEIFGSLCALDPSFMNDKLDQWKDLSAKNRKALLINLSRFGAENPTLPLVEDFLQELFDSPHKNDQQLLLEILSSGELQNAGIWVQKLAKRKDEDQTVQLLVAAGKLKLIAFVPEILQQLTIKAHQSHAREALYQMRETLFDDTELLLQETNEKTLVTLTEIAGKAANPEARKFLIALLGRKQLDPQLLIQAMANQNLKVQPNESEIFLKCIQKYKESANLKIRLHQELPLNEAPELIKALKSEIKNDCLLYLHLVAMLYGQEKINRVIEIIEFEQFSKIHNAIELLELSLPYATFKDIQPIVEYVTTHKPIELQIQHRQTFADVAKAILSQDKLFNAWTLSLTWFLAGRKNNAVLIQQLLQLPSTHQSSIFFETKEFVTSNPNKSI